MNKDYVKKDLFIGVMVILGVIILLFSFFIYHILFLENQSEWKCVEWWEDGIQSYDYERALSWCIEVEDLPTQDIRQCVKEKLNEYHGGCTEWIKIKR